MIPIRLVAELLLWGAFGTAVGLTPVIGTAGVAQEQTPRFRARADQVVLTATVRDGDGRPIEDLVVEDFEVRANGRTQPIDTFAYVSVPRSPRKIPSGDLGIPIVDVATNARPRPESGAFVLLIDDGAIRASDLVPLKRALTAFLETLSDDDALAVVFVQRSDLAVDFTTDVTRQTLVLDRLRAALGQQVEALGVRFRSVTMVLDNVVTALADMEHVRRTIVFVGGGDGAEVLYPRTPAPGATVGDMLQSQAMVAAATGQERLNDVIQRALRHGIPIYTLDPHGPASVESIFGMMPSLSENGRRELARILRTRQTFLATLAEATGGVAFVNHSDVIGAARSIVTDAGQYYLLGFTPSPYPRDGRFHEIDVQVTRRGLTVTARRGYVAPSPLDAGPGAAPSERLRDALGKAAPVLGLDLRAFAAPIGETGNRVTTLVTLEVAGGADEEGRSEPEALDTAFVVVDADGREVAFAAATGAAAEAAGPAARFLVNRTLDLPQGRQLFLRAGAADRRTGRVGTVHLPVDTDLRRGSRLETTPLIVGIARPADAAGSPVPGPFGLPFQPTTWRTFTSEQTLLVLCRVMSDEREVTGSSIALYRRGEQTPLGVFPMEQETAGSGDHGGHFAAVPLRGLEAGAYALVLDVMGGGGVAARRAVGFRIR
jgi:VWFA-related protein